MKKYLLTGGFGSGKSSVAQIFAQKGFAVIDADILSHQAIQPDQAAWQKLFASFGTKILNNDRTINRAKLAEAIFGDAELRKRVEKMIHPEVRHLIELQTEQYRKQKKQAVLLVIPLAFETGWVDEFAVDGVIVITAPEETRRERLKSQRGFAEADINRRFQAQLPDTVKVERAQHVIENTGSKADLEKKVAALALQLQK